MNAKPVAKLISVGMSSSKGMIEVLDGAPEMKIGTEFYLDALRAQQPASQGEAPPSGSAAEPQPPADEALMLLLEMDRLLRRYRREAPLGHQPYMIAHEVDDLLARIDRYLDGRGVSGMKDESELCPRCEKNPAEELHTCPYKCEIHYDDETVCQCCDDCRTECVYDI